MMMTRRTDLLKGRQQPSTRRHASAAATRWLHAPPTHPHDEFEYVGPRVGCGGMHAECVSQAALPWAGERTMAGDCCLKTAIPPSLAIQQRRPHACWHGPQEFSLAAMASQETSVHRPSRYIFKTGLGKRGVAKTLLTSLTPQSLTQAGKGWAGSVDRGSPSGLSGLSARAHCQLLSRNVRPCTALFV